MGTRRIHSIWMKVVPAWIAGPRGGEIRLLVAVMAVLALGGCPSSDNNPELQSISVTPAAPSIVAGSTQQFTATGTYDDDTTEDLTAEVTWSTSEPAYATISNEAGSEGLATGVAAGTLTVTATQDEISGTASLTVTSAGEVTQVTVSGRVTYTDYVPLQSGGLDYSNPVERAIRGAVVELRDSAGAVLFSTNTDSDGAYSFSNAPVDSSLTVLVKAALGSPSAPELTVVDNTNDGALYSLSTSVTTGSSNVTADFNAASGWDVSAYSGDRAAGPFAILDAIYEARGTVLSADADASFPALVVNWSPNNVPTSGSLAAGEIGTSFYSGGNLYILGAKDVDTDEYDSHVIVHEWGHYFEDKLSRSDSIGGSHGSLDFLDPRVAFGEGFGNALSGMVLNDSVYVDTAGSSQATVAVRLRLDEDSVSDTLSEEDSGADLRYDGFYSEASVQEVLYDIFDGGTDDDDGVELGFSAIYAVMVGGQKTTPAFTSIFSFLHYLKETNSSASDAITTLAANENIGSGDEYEDSEAPIYTALPPDGTEVSLDVDGETLATLDAFGEIDSGSTSNNKLLNHRFFHATIETAGCYAITVVPASAADLDIALSQRGSTVYATGASTDGESLTRELSADTYAVDISSYDIPVEFTIMLESSTSCS